MDGKERFKMDLGDFEHLPEIKQIPTTEQDNQHQPIKSNFQDFATVVVN